MNTDGAVHAGSSASTSSNKKNATVSFDSTIYHYHSDTIFDTTTDVIMEDYTPDACENDTVDEGIIRRNPVNIDKLAKRCIDIEDCRKQFRDNPGSDEDFQHDMDILYEGLNALYTNTIEDELKFLRLVDNRENREMIEEALDRIADAIRRKNE